MLAVAKSVSNQQTTQTSQFQLYLVQVCFLQWSGPEFTALELQVISTPVSTRSDPQLWRSPSYLVSCAICIVIFCYRHPLRQGICLLAIGLIWREYREYKIAIGSTTRNRVEDHVQVKIDRKLTLHRTPLLHIPRHLRENKIWVADSSYR